jgi:hypothetical protein
VVQPSIDQLQKGHVGWDHRLLFRFLPIPIEKKSISWNLRSRLPYPEELGEAACVFLESLFDGIKIQPTTAIDIVSLVKAEVRSFQ